MSDYHVVRVISEPRPEPKVIRVKIIDTPKTEREILRPRIVSEPRPEPEPVTFKIIDAPKTERPIIQVKAIAEASETVSAADALDRLESSLNG